MGMWERGRETGGRDKGTEIGNSEGVGRGRAISSYKLLFVLKNVNTDHTTPDDYNLSEHS